jgi:hypothetical protein
VNSAAQSIQAFRVAGPDPFPASPKSFCQTEGRIRCSPSAPAELCTRFVCHPWAISRGCRARDRCLRLRSCDPPLRAHPPSPNAGTTPASLMISAGGNVKALTEVRGPDNEFAPSGMHSHQRAALRLRRPCRRLRPSPRTIAVLTRARCVKACGKFRLAPAALEPLEQMEREGPSRPRP